MAALRSLALPEGLRWSLDLVLEDLDQAKRQLKRATEALERLSHTGNSKKAIVAMARKLGIIFWRMLTRGEAYRGLQVQGAGNEPGAGNRRLRKEGASPARARG